MISGDKIFRYAQKGESSDHMFTDDMVFQKYNLLALMERNYIIGFKVNKVNNSPFNYSVELYFESEESKVEYILWKDW